MKDITFAPSQAEKIQQIMPLSFQAIMPHHREAITQHTLASEFQNCDLAFANLASWQFLYDTHFAISDGMLFIRFRAASDSRPIYMMPIGRGDLAEALQNMRADACALGHELTILGITDQSRRQLEELTPDKELQCEPRRNSYDYIYLREALASLRGKKLQQKRNHVNRFIKAYDGKYEYRAITPDAIAPCLELLQLWSNRQGDDDRASVDYEQRMARFALENMEAIGLSVGALFVDSAMVAFTAGSPINANTFCIHIEKANTDYDGAFAMINREFASRIPEQYTYINREEDLGDEGLRRSKMSYQPAYMLEKCTLTKPIARRDQVRALWKHCFGDSEEFMDLHFNHRYCEDTTLTVDTPCRNIMSALQVFPYKLVVNEDEYTVDYVMGVSTYLEQRGNGYAEQLLRRAEQRARQANTDFIMLIPADDGLRSYYSRFGYLPAFGYDPVTYLIEQATPSTSTVDIAEHPLKLTKQLYHSICTLTKLDGNRILHTMEDYDIALADIALAGGTMLIATKNNCPTHLGVIVYVEKDEDSIDIKELLATNSDVEQALAHQAMSQSRRSKAHWRKKGSARSYASVIPLSKRAEKVDTTSSTITMMMD